jgi:hypothetical protein
MTAGSSSTYDNVHSKSPPEMLETFYKTVKRG